MAATEVKCIVTSATASSVILAPVAGQRAEDFGAPISDIRLRFGAIDTTVIGFGLNQAYLITIQKL